MTEHLPEWFPIKVKVSSYYSDAGESPDLPSVLKQLQTRYGGIYSEALRSLEIKNSSTQCFIKALSQWDTTCLLLAVGSTKTHGGSPSEYVSSEFNRWIKDLREAIPRNPDYDVSLTLNIANADNLESRLNYLSKESGHSVRSAGKVGRCLMAALQGEVPPLATNKEFLAIFHEEDYEALSHSAWPMCLEVCSLASIHGRINNLYSERRPMLSQMDASEGTTQVWINEVLARMRKPIDEAQPSDLEESLKEITIQFSRLSTLTNSMRRDEVKAKALIREARKLFSGWNEKPFDELPLNSSVELGELEDIIAPFSDFVERTEALTAQLNTVLDSVRTYLGIQQQKLSLAEQTSSRQQLIQLVNLQETLHKLEVLVVAFYLTEMARIVFETVSESAALLTALFIPVALLVSVLISRLLGKK